MCCLRKQRFKNVSAPTTTTTPQPETTTEIVTEVVTEIVTETEKFTETVTRIESVTEITSETSVGPAEVEKSEPEARIVLEVEPKDGTGNELIGSGDLESPFAAKRPEANCFAAILMGLKCGENPNIKPIDLDETVEPIDEDGTISTAKAGLVPDRDEFGAKPMTVSVEDPPKLTSNPFQVCQNLLSLTTRR